MSHAFFIFRGKGHVSQESNATTEITSRGATPSTSQPRSPEAARRIRRRTRDSCRSVVGPKTRSSSRERSTDASSVLQPVATFANLERLNHGRPCAGHVFFSCYQDGTRLMTAEFRHRLKRSHRFTTDGVQCDNELCHCVPITRDHNTTRRQILELLGWIVISFCTSGWRYARESAPQVMPARSRNRSKVKSWREVNPMARVPLQTNPSNPGSWKPLACEH